MGGCGTKVLDNTKLGKHHFEFQIIIGEGGFGKVNAVIRKTGKKKQSAEDWYAIKTMSKKQILKKGKHGLDMLFNEKNLLADLRSEFIIQMHHCFHDDDSCYIVMDLMLGGDLRFHMARRDFFTEKDARFYIALCCLSLRDCHKALIIHRDVKPDNIVLDPQGYARLTDFGISTKIDSIDAKCNLGSGTKPYMAPEMLSKTHEHGIEADMFMVGVMAFELLTGKRPYKEGVNKSTVKWIQQCVDEKDLTDELPSSHEPNKIDQKFKVSAECQSFVSMLLEPRPWKRMSTKNFDDVLKKHPFFTGFDWEAVEAKDHNRAPAPIKPNADTANCDTVGNNLVDTLMGEEKQEKLTPEEQAKFLDYGYMDALDPETGEPTGHSSGGTPTVPAAANSGPTVDES